MTGISRPTGAPDDWPEFPAVPLLLDDEPLPAGQWPTLAPTWQTVTPHVLNPDLGHRIDAWLVQPGAPGPLASAYRHRWNGRYPYGWSCGIHVVGIRISYDCTGCGIARTPDEARADALRHITERHPDAALPYAPRFLRAQHFYA